MPVGPRVIVSVLLLGAVAVAGCAGDDDTRARPGTRATVDLAAGPSADQGRITATAHEAFDYDEYEASVEELATLIDEYWEDAFQRDEGRSYGRPADVYGYYPGEDDDDVQCDGESWADPGNAFYCGDSDEIGWDEPGLFIPYYRDKGDLAIGIVLAHEWGHLIQNRYDEDFSLTYEKELNADCLAGTWLGAMDDEGYLDGKAPGDGGDIDEAADAIFSLGDDPDTSFEDPEAHGRPQERLDALETGYDGGRDACDTEYGPGWTDE
jgi:predicted metalloprotease